MADEREFPDVEFVETDTETMMAEAIEEYEAAFDRTLQPADPAHQMLLWYTAITSQTRSIINIAAKRNLPRYAEGEYLDSLSELFYGVTRQSATPSVVKMQFNLSEAQSIEVTIPEGTEVTTESGEPVFATIEELVIPPGELQGVVTAECTEDGTQGNGIPTGVINTMIDVAAYVESVQNINASEGGEDEEDDASLYDRMKESLEAYSTAGTAGAYKYHAMEHNSNVESVVVTTPAAGCVDIIILMRGGEVPNEATISEMQEYLRSDEIRALTDLVTVKAPETVPFSVKFTYSPDADSTESREAIEAKVRKAVDDYVSWQTRTLGRRINPSKLIALLVTAGINDMNVEQPTITDVGEAEIGQCVEISIECKE